MVKLVCLIKRKPGLSPEEFHRYWREEHGPLVVRASGQFLLRYEQNHRPLSDYGKGDDDNFDGAAIEWFESADDFWAMVKDPSYLAELYPDEDRFLDRDSMVWLLTQEPDVFIDKISGS
jgi:uncharacterized protein (TIGR02118 family)